MLLSLFPYAIWKKLTVAVRGLLTKPRTACDIVIVKLDEIGDYLLFRNFISELRQNHSPADLNIVIIGNIVWKELMLHLDGKHITEFIEIDLNKTTDREYIRSVIRRTAAIKTKTLINGSFTRKPISDLIAFCVSASRKTCFADKSPNRGQAARLRDHFYTEAVSLPADCTHEFQRNKYYYGQIARRSLAIRKPYISVIDDPGCLHEHQLPSGYIVIFIGATDSGRKWPISHYSKIISDLANRIGVVLIGGPAESPDSIQITRSVPESARVKNLVGKTTLIETLHIIMGSVMVIGNESGVIHMADAAGIPSVCILGGGHYGRFVPYPADCGSSIEPIFRQMECYHCNWTCRFERKQQEPYPCIGSIEKEQVRMAIEKKLNWN